MAGRGRKWSPVDGALGDNTSPQDVAATLLLVSICVFVYVTVILPGIQNLQCGLERSDEYKEYIKSSPYTNWLGPDGLPNTGDDVGDQPAEPPATMPIVIFQGSLSRFPKFYPS